MWTKNFQIYKLDLEKKEEPEIKLPTSVGSQKKQGNSKKKKKIYSCFIDYTKAFKEMGIPDHHTCLLRKLYAGQKQHLQLDMDQRSG